MTKNFVERTGLRNVRIPLHPQIKISVDEPFILISPTYGAGKGEGAVPKPVIHFLNDPDNRKYLVGVIGTGNKNYVGKYCLAAKYISHKMNVPLLYMYELLGLPEDVAAVKEIVRNLNVESINREPNLPERETESMG